MDDGAPDPNVLADLRRAPPTKVLCLFKVDKKEHLDALVEGRLYCRHLAFYKSQEDAEQPWQDAHEGLAGVFQAERINLIFTSKDGQRHVINAESGLVGSVFISADLDRPAFCLYAIHTGEWTHRQFTEAELDAFKAYLHVPDDMEKFGTHVWIIKNADEFGARVRSACRRLGLNHAHGLIRYVEASEMHGTIPRELVGFVKLKIFSPQHEFRFVFISENALPDPFILDVGSLADITEVVSFQEFRDKMRIDFEGDETAGPDLPANEGMQVRAAGEDDKE